MSIYKELSFENDIETIKAIQFTVMSPKEIESKSVCEIVSTDTYSGNEPIIGGLFDSRMGVIENDKICKTCNQKNTFCPGHFGHINLAKPVFYIQFFDTVRKILKCVCFRCSRLLMDPENPLLIKMVNKKFSRQKRFEFVYKCCTKIKRCGQENKDGCGAKLPHKTIKENIGKIIMEWKDDDVVRKNVYNAEDILIILKRITNEEANILGFPSNINRPENLICQTFSVPPPSVRPSVRNDTGQRCEDDLTHKLCDIIKTNNTLKQKIERDSTNPDQIDYWYILLQFHIATFVDNQLPGIPPAKQRTGRPLRSLTERLKSKEGRIRGNLMGKRVDFSARSVITPDPNIDIDELGVPIKIAMNLTFPEIVNANNIDELYRLVMNGNDTYPGAKYIRKNEGNGYRTIRLKNLQKENIKLEFGDIVDRHLRNGDYVLFNRQPSLHKMSMMAHKVRVMSYETFRLNVCCTPSYNADYDGDEMNMHVPQSKQTEYELMALASVPTQIISPRESSPIISVVQDIVVGLYRISKENVFVNNKQYFNILAGNSKFTGKFMLPSSQINGAKIWKGRELLSSVLNPLINLKAGKGVEIHNGVITKGTVDKKLYQEMTYGLIQYVYNEFGADECKALFDNTQRLICDWLVYNGFSVGISDLIVNDTTQDKLKNVVKDLKVDVYEIIRDIHMNTFENSSIMNNLEHFENLINQKLDKATKDINNIGTENINDADNRMMNMINSKSKGNPINVSQMMGSVGQQSVEGKRINYGFDNRTLPHFTKYDDGPESRGFVENSFIKGLTAQEFFFHAMGGREGLIDTAVKSVIGETKIIIIEKEKIKTTTIGEWVDEQMNINASNIQHFPEDRNMEFLELPSKSVFIPTGDDKGVVSWGELTAVTRHDPGTRVFKIKTKSGRSLTVADSESLLIWNDDTKEFKKMLSELIQIGDCVPTVYNIPQTKIIITHNENLELNKENGRIIGKSIGKEISCVPDYTFISPTSFVTGVIEGFVSKCNKTVDFNRMEFNIDCDYLLIDAISHLFNRLGVFTVKTSDTTITIKDKWVQKFLDIVKLDEPFIFDLEQLANQINSNEYNTTNDMVLDPIVDIEILGVEEYPKLYDVTVPSTLNFITMNGINIRDTSETGYIQRKLIKAMEDAKVSFDMTVRNAGGNIIQFMYGEDSIDPIKLEKHHLDYFKFGVDITYMEDNYLITERDNLKYILKDDVIKTLYDTDDWQDRFQQYYKQILNDREFIITNVFNGKSDDVIFHPICVYRMIEKIENMFNLKNMNFTSELNPLYVLDKIDELIEDLRINKKTPPVKLLGVVVRHYFSPKKLIFKHKFTKDAFDYMVEHFKQRYLEALVHPSDMVGVVAAQSIGEPSTQLTLNSVEYNTEIIVSENGKLKEYRIGEWIESRIANGDTTTHQYIEKGDQIYAPISEEEDVRILSSDENGNVFWDNIDAVTKHLPINEDGTNTLIRVTTLSGHACVVTKGESVLTRKNNKLLKSKASELKIGDYLPAMKTLPIPEYLKIEELDISEYVSRNDYIFMSEVEKALKIKGDCEKAGERHWWSKNKDKNFKLPYNRSDCFVDAFLGIGDKPGRRMQLDNRENCVYPKFGIYQSAHIPEKIKLDRLFGFVVGAYLAEGCLTKYHVLISNNNDSYIEIIEEWANKHHIKYHFDESVKPSGYSRTIRLHSLVLADLFEKLFNQEVIEDTPTIINEENINNTVDDIIDRIVYDTHKDSKESKHTVKSSSKNKHLPVFMLCAPDECLKGVIDGYFSGDGNISQKLVQMSAVSVSKQLLENISLVMRKFGIFSSIRESPGMYKNALKQGYHTTMPYTIFLNKHNTICFANTFKLTIDYKQERLDEFKDIVYNKDCLTDTIPNVVLSNQYIDKMSIHAIDLKNYENPEDVEVMKSIMQSNIFYDKVVKIEEVESKHTHVFDLTTRISRNFADKSIVLVDTFHLSGVASASKAVRGVPRIKELLSVSKNMKAPSCTIYLNDNVKNYTDAKKARFSIETTYMKSLVTKSDIYYEPKNNITNIEDDQKIIDEYNKFSELDDECYTLVSPWILRMELDRSKMMDVGLTTMDINIALKKYYNDSIMCMFSDDNNEKVIFRIALTDVDIADIITDLKALEYNIMEKIIISGIDKIKKISISQKKRQVLNDEPFRTFEDKEEYVLETDGTNLSNVLANNFVNREKTISNDITEIYELFGIEAARQALYNEIDDILNSTTSVNHRHIALLVDTMTCKGYLLSIDRHGINRSDIGPLAKCSFEETSDILIKAGVFGETDKINGVSANIILGQIAKCGTGDTQVMMDMDRLPDMAVERKIEELEEIEEGEPDCSMEFDFEYEFGNKTKVFEEKTTSKLIIT